MKENPEAPGAGAGSSSGTEVDAGTQPVRVLPPAGPEPRGAPPSSGAVITVALLLCAVGALCIHELLVFHGIVDGAPWLANSFTWIAQLTWRDWMRYAAPAAVIVGIVSL
ncbi:MAG: hypothetical protein L0H59_04720, partial [Tomitella sp.]|nr:hypothetical protein [Tomitella sp.]